MLSHGTNAPWAWQSIEKKESQTALNGDGVDVAELIRERVRNACLARHKRHGRHPPGNGPDGPTRRLSQTPDLT